MNKISSNIIPITPAHILKTMKTDDNVYSSVGADEFITSAPVYGQMLWADVFITSAPVYGQMCSSRLLQ